MESSTNNIHSILTNSIENFRNMAMRGERAIRKNDTTEGIQFLERALLIGTDDQLLLSAVYSQLGNAYFAMRNYNQARLYHMSDLNASRTLNDEAQQAKAYSNLSATYSMLIEYENAILCATNVISIGKKLGDAMIECRGHYNLGLAHLNYAISIQSSDFKENFELGDHGLGLKKQEHLQKSLDEFELSLNIAEEHNDRILCGLALGNIGNAYFHALNYRKAIEYHEKRLLIARELGDKTSIRRTLTNIAKAKILLGELYEGRESYSAALDIAKEIKLPVEIIAKLESEITNASSLIDNIVKREVYSPSSVGTNAPKSLCDAGTSPFSDSTVERLSKSTTQLDIMGNNKPKRQLEFAELFRSDRKARNDDFFDMIDKMQGKRIEDQRAEFPSSSQMDNRSVNIDFANSSNSSSNHGRGIGNSLKRGTIKRLTNMKSMVNRLHF